ncbi:MAG: hypothetical protein BroJett011_33360 [Chloroflexota bacterium]|nr:MAG: hypothetical protein BroJett011_33360 [Chloroflexota bacterium]
MPLSGRRRITNYFQDLPGFRNLAGPFLSQLYHNLITKFVMFIGYTFNKGNLFDLNIVRSRKANYVHYPRTIDQAL